MAGIEITVEEAAFIVDVLHASATTLWPDSAAERAVVLAEQLEAARISLVGGTP